VGEQSHAPAALPVGNRPGVYCTGGSVGPRIGLDGCGKPRPYRDSISGSSSPVILVSSQINTLLISWHVLVLGRMLTGNIWLLKLVGLLYTLEACNRLNTRTHVCNSK
jgi:hypothetical protein